MVLQITVAVALAPLAADQSLPPDLRIVGTSTAYQSQLHSWSVLYGPRPVKESVDGHEPPAWFPSYLEPGTAGLRLFGVDFNYPISRLVPGGVLSTVWEEPVEFVWDFGDGTTGTTGQRPLAHHRYLEVGSAVITVTMRSLTDGRTVAVASRSVEVVNTKPSIWRMTAVRSMEEARSFVLDANVYDSTADTIEYAWDFGDGSPVVEDGPRVEHRFPPSGTYTVRLTARDGHESSAQGAAEDVETKDVEIVSAEEPASPPAPTTGEEEPPESTAATTFTAQVTGAIQTELQSEVRPFVGIFLGPAGPRRCRLLMTAWDPQQLLVVTLMADLPGAAIGEGRYELKEGEYSTRARYAQLSVQPSAEEYQTWYDSNGSGRQGLGSFALGHARPVLDRERGEGWEGEIPGDETGGDDAWMSTINRVLRTSGAGFVQLGPREEQTFAGPPVATSPFGEQDPYGFEGRGGTVDLFLAPQDRLEGSFSVSLTDPSTPSRGTVSVAGEFVLNLVTAPRDGLVMYQCGADTFEVTGVAPAGDREIGQRASVGVSFSGDVDPNSVDPWTFEVGYPDDSGNFVPVAGRRLTDQRGIWFVPDAPWLSGVRHTARVKTGEHGVVSRGGAQLFDADGDGWYQWDFWTQIDFDAALGHHLACHLFQPVRDAPLVAGKPAVARVYAHWENHERVAVQAQRRQFEARVVGRDGGAAAGLSVLHTFVRPDLWEHVGLDQAAAEHTANLFGIVPASDERLPIRLRVQVRRGETWSNRYSVSCPAEMWDHAPVLTFDWYLAPLGRFGAPAATGGRPVNAGLIVPLEIRQAEAIEISEGVAAAAADLIRQQFPFVEVRSRYRGIAPLVAPELGPDGLQCLAGTQNQRCVLEALLPLTESGGADLIVYFGPAEVLGGGGSKREIDGAAGTKGLVAMGIADDPQTTSWATMGLAHEIGHTLGLEHKPFLGSAYDPEVVSRHVLKAQRDGGLHFEHEGIEGFRLALDGSTGWNKSSSEGNGESPMLAPLMFPITLAPEEVFIARDHYFQLLDRIARSPRWAGGQSAPDAESSP